MLARRGAQRYGSFASQLVQFELTAVVEGVAPHQGRVAFSEKIILDNFLRQQSVAVSGTAVLLRSSTPTHPTVQQAGDNRTGASLNTTGALRRGEVLRFGTP